MKKSTFSIYLNYINLILPRTLPTPYWLHPHITVAPPTCCCGSTHVSSWLHLHLGFWSRWKGPKWERDGDKKGKKCGRFPEIFCFVCVNVVGIIYIKQLFVVICWIIYLILIAVLRDGTVDRFLKLTVTNLWQYSELYTMYSDIKTNLWQC